MAKAKQQPEWQGAAYYLIEAREAMTLSVEKVADAYKQACRDEEVEAKSQSTVKSWLYGWTIPTVNDYMILAIVINDHLREIGRMDKLVPEIST